MKRTVLMMFLVWGSAGFCAEKSENNSLIEFCHALETEDQHLLSRLSAGTMKFEKHLLRGRDFDAETAKAFSDPEFLKEFILKLRRSDFTRVETAKGASLGVWIGERRVTVELRKNKEGKVVFSLQVL